MEELEKIKKPWHEQWWFITLMVIVGLIIISTGIFGVMNRRKHATFITLKFYPDHNNNGESLPSIDVNKLFIASKDNGKDDVKRKQIESLPSIDIKTLYQAFKENEVNAKEKYFGKEYLFTGMMDSKSKWIVEDSSGAFLKEITLITLTDGRKASDSSVNCLFYTDKGYLDILQEGETHLIKGTITAFDTNILVDNCEVILYSISITP
ncbi:MAG: hypothetical protein PHD83_01050 [Caldisericia bacterium]|nr:hypothetical protein [Caldisericia bacterium]